MASLVYVIRPFSGTRRLVTHTQVSYTHTQVSYTHTEG